LLAGKQQGVAMTWPQECWECKHFQPSTLSDLRQIGRGWCSLDKNNKQPVISRPGSVCDKFVFQKGYIEPRITKFTASITEHPTPLLAIIRKRENILGVPHGRTK